MEKLGTFERDILDRLEDEWIGRGYRPTYDELAEFLETSKNRVYRHCQELEKLDYIRCESTSRGIILLRTIDGYPVTSGGYQIPVLGNISAGNPISLPDHSEPTHWIDVTSQMVSGNPKGVFALSVHGDSMIEDRVYDGNTVVVRRQDYAEDGDTIAARILTDRTTPQTTLKKFYRVDDKIQLSPRNSSLQSKLYESSDVEILGKLLSVLNIE
jgi:repressor LexA